MSKKFFMMLVVIFLCVSMSACNPKQVPVSDSVSLEVYSSAVVDEAYEPEEELTDYAQEDELAEDEMEKEPDAGYNELFSVSGETYKWFDIDEIINSDDMMLLSIWATLKFQTDTSAYIYFDYEKKVTAVTVEILTDQGTTIQEPLVVEVLPSKIYHVEMPSIYGDAVVALNLETEDGTNMLEHIFYMDGVRVPEYKRAMEKDYYIVEYSSGILAAHVSENTLKMMCVSYNEPVGDFAYKLDIWSNTPGKVAKVSPSEGFYICTYTMDNESEVLAMFYRENDSSMGNILLRALCIDGNLTIVQKGGLK